MSTYDVSRLDNAVNHWKFFTQGTFTGKCIFRVGSEIDGTIDATIGELFNKIAKTGFSAMMKADDIAKSAKSFWGKVVKYPTAFFVGLFGAIFALGFGIARYAELLVVNVVLKNIVFGLIAGIFGLFEYGILKFINPKENYYHSMHKYGYALVGKTSAQRHPENYREFVRNIFLKFSRNVPPEASEIGTPSVIAEWIENHLE